MTRAKRILFLITVVILVWLVGVSVVFYHQKHSISVERQRVHSADTATSCKKEADTIVDGYVIPGEVGISCLMHLGDDRESELEESLGKYIVVSVWASIIVGAGLVLLSIGWIPAERNRGAGVRKNKSHRKQ